MNTDKETREFFNTFIMEYLEQVDYWYRRFELSRDTKHLEHAERFADVVREHLPWFFENFSVIELRNLFWSLFDPTGPRKELYHDQ